MALIVRATTAVNRVKELAKGIICLSSKSLHPILIFGKLRVNCCSSHSKFCRRLISVKAWAALLIWFLVVEAGSSWWPLQFRKCCSKLWSRYCWKDYNQAPWRSPTRVFSNWFRWGWQSVWLFMVFFHKQRPFLWSMRHWVVMWRFNLRCMNNCTMLKSIVMLLTYYLKRNA